MRETFIVILQEIKLHAYNALKEYLSDIAQIEYSLSYRIPSKYDTDSRKLGVVILISKDIVVKNAKILDRALMVNATFNNMPLRIFGLHSITGCQHLKAKEIQYFLFAEAIDTTSYIIKRGKKKVRYDFLFINGEKFRDYFCKYEYGGAVCAGSDHAVIIAKCQGF